MRIVHIGFPKTASVFLQTNVFPALHADYAFLDKSTCALVFAPVLNHDDSIFDLAEAKRRIDQASGQRNRVLVSYEPLTGLEYRSGFVNRTLTAKRLRALEFDRAIITIRNQFDVLESAYRQYVRSGGVLKFTDYLTFEPHKPKYLYPEYFDYYSIYRLYADTFGAANVLVLQYERLRETAFLADLFAFLQIEPVPIQLESVVNRSLSYRKTAILRVVNHWTYNAYRPSHLISSRFSTSLAARVLAAVPWLNSDKSFLDPRTRAAVATFYSESNARLREAAGIQLAAAYP